jgi:hypothetical protein
MSVDRMARMGGYLVFYEVSAPTFFWMACATRCTRLPSRFQRQTGAPVLPRGLAREADSQARQACPTMD